MKQTLLDKQFDFFITFAQQSRSAGPPSFYGVTLVCPLTFKFQTPFSSFKYPSFVRFYYTSFLLTNSQIACYHW